MATFPSQGPTLVRHLTAVEDSVTRHTVCINWDNYFLMYQAIYVHSDNAMKLKIYMQEVVDACMEDIVISSR
jgi:hypothetical protein